MATPTATVEILNDRVNVWATTQNVQATLLVVADQLKRDPKDVYAHGTFQGGAFGLGNHHDATRQAAQQHKYADMKQDVEVEEEDLTPVRVHVDDGRR